MWTRLARFLSLVGIVALSSTPLWAQEPTADDLTLRPGDRITWSPSAPHRLRFGGTVTHKGASLELTSFEKVKEILDITPALTADGNGVAMGATGEKVTATVKGTATAGAEFFFTCGFAPHNGIMVTVPFKVAAGAGQPPRQIEIISANPPRWVLKTAAGDKSLSRP